MVRNAMVDQYRRAIEVALRKCGSSAAKLQMTQASMSRGAQITTVGSPHTPGSEAHRIWSPNGRKMAFMKCMRVRTGSHTGN
jgi:hypothetical protein